MPWQPAVRKRPANIATGQTNDTIMQTDTYFAEQSARAAWRTVARDLTRLAERWEAEAASCDKAKVAPGNDPEKALYYEGKRDAYLRCAAALEKAVGRLPFQGG